MLANKLNHYNKSEAKSDLRGRITRTKDNKVQIEVLYIYFNKVI